MRCCFPHPLGRGEVMVGRGLSTVPPGTTPPKCEIGLAPSAILNPTFANISTAFLLFQPKMEKAGMKLFRKLMFFFSSGINEDLEGNLGKRTGPNSTLHTPKKVLNNHSATMPWIIWVAINQSVNHQINQPSNIFSYLVHLNGYG